MNLGVQHNLGKGIVVEAAYVGSRGVHLPLILPYNDVPFDRVLDVLQTNTPLARQNARPYPLRLQDRGFQEVLIHGGVVTQTPDVWGNTYFNDTYFHNGQPEKFAGYCTDVFAFGALKFIAGKRDKPFFVYLALNAPHAPYNVAENYSRPYLEQGVPAARAQFYGMITEFDQQLAQLRAKLKELNLEKETILIFMTDNGAAEGYREAGNTPANDTQGFNAGVRGAKGSPYDGGHRVPFFIRWPSGGITGGREVNCLAAHLDVLPTLIELCGLKPQGHSLESGADQSRALGQWLLDD